MEIILDFVINVAFEIISADSVLRIVLYSRLVRERIAEDGFIRMRCLFIIFLLIKFDNHIGEKLTVSKRCSLCVNVIQSYLYMIYRLY